MSCLSALHTQIGTLFSVPHEILLLRHKVFREYAKIAVGPDFIHTLPSFLILTAVVLILWKNPPSSTRIMNIVGGTFIYKIFQESEYRDISYPWWQHVWSSYYPVSIQPPIMSACFISWIITMTIAVIALGCANSTDRVETFVKESLVKFWNALAMVKLCMEWSEDGAQEEIPLTTEANAILDEGEMSIVCDDDRLEMSNDINNAPRGDIHPISYGTNWMPQPNFSSFKEMQRKMSMKSFQTVAGANDVQDPDKFATKQLRNRRGCHTVIPSNSNEQSSEC
ncbi:hypothetical protein ALC62_05403 [Cyphomyrmex costatus]|uniref:Uncharacterized protein n=1 Tax=Cyphomyrmex costatus TaxID=456900 RepID=A0A195CT60_9HYME|nr:hypothetical protein ALC62_05403 [Cyphomyrmex costatus]